MWINVKDQLPLVSIKGGIWTSLVLVWCYDGYMCIAQYDYFDKCWQGNGGKVDVTHWMPLPEPPTAVNSGAQTEQHPTAPAQNSGSYAGGKWIEY